MLWCFIHLYPYPAIESTRLRVRAPHLGVENQTGYRDHDSELSTLHALMDGERERIDARRLVESRRYYARAKFYQCVAHKLIHIMSLFSSRGD